MVDDTSPKNNTVANDRVDGMLHKLSIFMLYFHYLVCITDFWPFFVAFFQLQMDLIAIK